MLAFGLTDFAVTPNLYLALCGVSLGFIEAASGAASLERYGVWHMGAIRWPKREKMLDEHA